MHITPERQHELDIINETRKLVKSDLSDLLAAIIYISGTVNELYNICNILIDDKDARLINAKDGLKMNKRVLLRLEKSLSG